MKKTINSIFKSFGAILTVLVLLTMIPCAALADGTDSSEETYEVYIDDAADLLSDSQEADLKSRMEPLTEYGNIMFTTVTLEGSDYTSHAQNVYYEHYGNEPGVNFQIDMGNRQLTLSCSTDMENELGSERDTIVDNIYTYATDGDYYSCADECFQEIYKVLHDEQIAHKMKYINNAIIALILGLMLNFFLVFTATRGKSTEKYLEKASVIQLEINKVSKRNTKTTKKYSPPSSSSGGGGFSDGGGGGGGGGFSGGSSSHGF